MTSYDTIAANIAHVRETIAAACKRADRSPDEVTLLAISKTQSPEAILAAVAAGAQQFGENRVEESRTKIPAVNEKSPVPLTWHMVGHIQSRKASEVPPLFQVVHSVDSVKLAAKLSRLVSEAGGGLDVFLEVNISGEASKQGFAAHRWQQNRQVREQFWTAFGEILSLPGLNVRGLMTMAPIVDDMEEVRPVFRDLSALRAALAADLGVSLPDLSMGMTDDYPVAVEEGATIVRVGRAIFGPRR